ncbi:MAG: proteasome assembly chaperone family protein [Candidatus Nanohaloarchaea archaeon]
MESTTIEITKEPEAENPILIEGLAGIGHIGRNTVSYLADHLEAEKVGEIHSHHFPPYTIVSDDNTVDVINNNIYELKRDEKPDLVFLEGNAQASTSQGHYEVAEKVLEFIERVDAREIITVGGYGTGEVVEDPDVLAAASSTDQKEKYSEHDIRFDSEIGQVVGASGLIIGLGEKRGYEGLCLLGETPGFLMSDPKSTEEVLKVLEDILEEDIDYSALDEKVEESQDVLKKLKNIQNKQNPDQESQQGGPDLGYIG